MRSTINTIAFTVLILLMGGLSVNAQTSTPKVIALLNKASWCHVCKENGPRVEKDLMPMLMKDKNVQIVVNNLSDDKSKAASQPMLEKAGVEKFAKKNTGTGMLYFIDAKSKKLLSSVSVAKPNKEIMMAYKGALTKLDK